LYQISICLESPINRVLAFQIEFSAFWHVLYCFEKFDACPAKTGGIGMKIEALILSVTI